MSIGFALTFYPELRLLANSLRSFRQDQKLNQYQLSKSIGVGVLKAKSCIMWLGMLGLRDNKKRRLTSLGELVLKYDPYFEQVEIQWLLHYKLASNPKAEVWYLLSNEFLPGQTRFSFDDAINFLASKGLRSQNDKHLRADVSIFLRSFTSADALGKTEYLKIENDPKEIVSQNKFYKNPPTDIPSYLIAYVIYDQREKNFPNLSTVTIEELLSLKENVGRVFLLNRPKLEEILKLLSSPQYNQLIYLATTAGLDQVSLKFKGNPLEILEMYYTKENER